MRIGKEVKISAKETLTYMGENTVFGGHIYQDKNGFSIMFSKKEHEKIVKKARKGEKA